MARIGPTGGGGSSGSDSDTEGSSEPRQQSGSSIDESRRADRDAVDRLKESQSPRPPVESPDRVADESRQADREAVKRVKDQRSDRQGTSTSQPPRSDLGNTSSANADEQVVRRLKRERSSTPRATEPPQPTRTDLGTTPSAEADERVVRRIKEERTTRGPRRGGSNDVASRVERGAGALAAEIGGYLDSVTERSRQNVSPVVGSALTRDNVATARSGERELARRAAQGDIGAQIFQFGEGVQVASGDFGGLVTDGTNYLIDYQKSLYSPLPFVSDAQESILNARLGEASVRDQVSGFTGALASGPGLVAGGVIQAGSAVGSAGSEYVNRSVDTATDIAQASQKSPEAAAATAAMFGVPLVTGNAGTSLQRLGDASGAKLDTRTTNRLVDTSTTSLRNQADYAASRPLEAGLLYAAPAVAGGKRGVATDVARGRRAASATRGAGELVYRKAPNRLTDPVTRTTGRTKYRARDLKAETRLKLSQQAETVQRLSDAVYRQKSRGRTRAREAKADLRFEAQRRTPDVALEAPQRVQDSLFRVKQRQKARAREAKADARYAKDVASSEISRNIVQFTESIRSRLRGDESGGYDTIVSRSNLKYDGEGSKYPTFEPESGLNPFRETKISIEGTKSGSKGSKGARSGSSSTKSSGRSRGGISDVRRTRGNRGGTIQRTRGGGSRQQTILKQRRKSPPKKTNTGGGAETLIDPARTRSVKPPLFSVPTAGTTPPKATPEVGPGLDFETGETTGSVDVLSPPDTTFRTGTVTDYATTPDQRTPQKQPPETKTPTGTTTTSISTPDVPTTTTPDVPMMPTLSPPEPPRKRPKGLPYLGGPGGGGRYAPREFSSYDDKQYEFEFATVGGFLAGSAAPGKKKRSNKKKNSGSLIGYLF